jgi:hypothetical protein
MRTIIPVIAALILCLLGYGAYWYFSTASTPSTVTEQPSTPVVDDGITSLPPALEASGQKSYYRDSNAGYSFEIPAGYTASEYGKDTPGPEVILFHSMSEFFDFRILPSTDTSPPTAASVEAEQPTLGTIATTTPIVIAPNCSGIVFERQNDRWDTEGGHTVWFVCHGYRFWLSGPKQLGGILEAIAHTFSFTQS